VHFHTVLAGDLPPVLNDEAYKIGDLNKDEDQKGMFEILSIYSINHPSRAGAFYERYTRDEDPPCDGKHHGSIFETEPKTRPEKNQSKSQNSDFLTEGPVGYPNHLGVPMGSYLKGAIAP
jgi:hypothetical protein